jgi:hypothetical protein
MLVRVLGGQISLHTTPGLASATRTGSPQPPPRARLARRLRPSSGPTRARLARLQPASVDARSPRPTQARLAQNGLASLDTGSPRSTRARLARRGLASLKPGSPRSSRTSTPQPPRGSARRHLACRGLAAAGSLPRARCRGLASLNAAGPPRSSTRARLSRHRRPGQDRRHTSPPGQSQPGPCTLLQPSLSHSPSPSRACGTWVEVHVTSPHCHS